MNLKSNAEIRAALSALRADIDAAISGLAAKHGLERLVAGGASFTGDGAFTFKLEGLFAGGTSREAALYEQLRSYTPGLPPLGAEFTATKLGVCRITGSNTTGSKIMAQTKDGKTYLFPVDGLVRKFKAMEMLAKAEAA